MCVTDVSAGGLQCGPFMHHNPLAQSGSWSHQHAPHHILCYSYSPRILRSDACLVAVSPHIHNIHWGAQASHPPLNVIGTMSFFLPCSCGQPICLGDITISHGIEKCHVIMPDAMPPPKSEQLVSNFNTFAPSPSISQDIRWVILSYFNSMSAKTNMYRCCVG